MKSKEHHSLTSRQFAEALGVSESSVKRWVDDGEIAAHRTSGGHRRIPMAAAIGFIRRHRSTIERPDLLTVRATSSSGRADSAVAEVLFEALRRDDAAEARAIISGRYLGGADIAAIGDGLIRPALKRLGELWRSDSQGILVEHRAVDTCIRVFSDLLAWLPPPPPGAPVAVTAAGPGDPYLLPPMLASMTLQERGIRAHNLGPATPLKTIVLAAERYGASMCSLSVSTAEGRRAPAEWTRFADSLENRRTKLVVGGRCLDSLPAEFLGRVHACASMSELGAYASGVVHGVSPGLKPTRGVRS